MSLTMSLKAVKLLAPDIPTSRRAAKMRQIPVMTKCRINRLTLVNQYRPVSETLY